MPPEFATSKTASGADELSLSASSSLSYDIRRDGTSNLQLFQVSDLRPSYYVRNSMLRPGISPVTLFTERQDSQRKVVGACHFPAFSTTIAVGRGDPHSDPGEVLWETVSKVSRDHSIYEFSTVLAGEKERRTYQWKRTHDPALKDSKCGKWNRRSWKLEDRGSQQVVAVYAANMIKFRKEAGTIKLIGRCSEDWEQWVLLTYLGISEKARRRAMARRDISWFF